MIAAVSTKENAVRVNRFIHVPPWVRMKTTSVPGGALRPPSVARPSSAALDPWLCGPVLRRVCPYRERSSLATVGSMQAECQATGPSVQYTPISGNRWIPALAELRSRCPGGAVGGYLGTCFGGEGGHFGTPFKRSPIFQHFASQQPGLVGVKYSACP